MNPAVEELLQMSLIRLRHKSTNSSQILNGAKKWGIPLLSILLPIIAGRFLENVLRLCSIQLINHLLGQIYVLRCSLFHKSKAQLAHSFTRLHWFKPLQPTRRRQRRDRCRQLLILCSRQPYKQLRVHRTVSLRQCLPHCNPQRECRVNLRG